ncbi:DUF4390 domain-containing protein [Variovorax sp. EBFNA2]|nr:DUF4390 domain-containing protein [Variovorax boronicumulans]WPG40643.1 DUF4390 domain-containing protein [Variovorax boronicumulans]
MALFPAAATAQARAAGGATITQMRLEQADDGVYLSAAVQFELPTLVEDVLDKGIAIYFVAEAEVFQERWYWTDRKVAQVARHMRLAYQPLTRRWRLNVSPVPITGAAGFGISLNQNFDSLGDALEAIKRIGRLRLGDAAEIGDEPLHQVTFRFRLDTSQLPRPFQIGMVGQAEWNIAAERTARLPLEKQR